MKTQITTVLSILAVLGTAGGAYAVNQSVLSTDSTVQPAVGNPAPIVVPQEPAVETADPVPAPAAPAVGYESSDDEATSNDTYIDDDQYDDESDDEAYEDEDEDEDDD